MKKTAIVTGGSSGIGAATAKALAAGGYAVYEISRRGAGAPGVRHVTADLSDGEDAKRAIEEIAADAGRIDLLVNNAGSGISGAVEFTRPADARRQFEVNLFGAAAVMQAALPYLRESRGRILNVGSVAGSVAIPFQAWYSASKAALASLSDAVRTEVAPFGVSVCCLLPGDVQTAFTAARSRSEVGDDLYGGGIARSVAVMEHDEKNGMTPDYVARQIVKTARRKRVAPRYTIGTKYKLLLFTARLLPASLVRWVVGKMYAP